MAAQEILPQIVNSDGPLTARVLWVGEAPGHEEVYRGIPFIGASGKMVRRELQKAGVDVEGDVRFSNAVRHNPGAFPVGAAGAGLLKQYAEELDREILSMPNLRVIVACGGPAMTRLTGRRSKGDKAWGIERYHNFVFHHDDLPDVMEWAQGVRHPTVIPKRVLVIPVLHPAGIMRSKGRDETISFRVGVRKVADALSKRLRKCEFKEVFEPPVGVIEDAYKREVEHHIKDVHDQSGKEDHVQDVYIDTEYHKETKQVYWCGITFDGRTVYGFPWRVEYVTALARILRHDAVRIAAHNIAADLTALRTSGLQLSGRRIWCTLIAHHALHPALGVGLDDAARFYIGDLQQWKDLETDDPHYNAIDVAYGWHVMVQQLREARARQVDPLPEMRARMRLIPVAMEMEQRGMDVDIVCQNTMRKEAQDRGEGLREGIGQGVRPYWDKRVRLSEEALALSLQALEKMKLTHWATPCDAHPNRNGLYKPPKKCEHCKEVYDSAEMGERRKLYKKVQKEKVQKKNEATRWQKGFEPRNNEHLRWLLYDPYALQLPVQKTGRPPRPTANRAAIDKLSTLKAVRSRPEAFKIVLDIKEVQHLEKAVSTFIDIPLDKRGIAHPPYKIQGTRTGRLAGGSADDEKSDNRYAFNVLNIPREWRRMYVAPDNHVLVAADWRNVEGRLTALFCKDPAYQRVLDDELKGGPKVHSVNAGIIYGIDPADAKGYKIQLSGQERTAYDGGKRLTHAWSYGMKPPHMARTFNISDEEARRIDYRLTEAYPVLVRWRQQLVDDVLGLWEVVPGSRGQRCIQEGRRFLANPFGWQMYFLGINADQANEVIAFLPQSTGAGMFTRCAPQLEERYPIFTGTYDSFVLVVPADPKEVREARHFIVEVMEQEWPELQHKTFPTEVQVGYNWGEADDSNPRGLKEVA